MEGFVFAFHPTPSRPSPHSSLSYVRWVAYAVHVFEQIQGL